MSDLIQNAIQKTTAISQGKLQAPIDTNQVRSVNKLDEIPIKKDPELVKKQLKAEKTKLKSKANQLRRTAKQKALDESKKILKQLAKKAISTIKLPILDPKILQIAILAKKKKEEMESRQAEAATDIDQNAEAFTFPMKKPSGIPEIPKVPEIPKLPDIKSVDSAVQSTVKAKI